MKKKKINKIIESFKDDDKLLRNYNFYLTMNSNLPGEFRNLNNDEKQTIYNRLSNNLEIIINLMTELQSENEILKKKKETKRVLNKLISNSDFYRELFTLKLEYGILDNLKEEIDNPKKLDLETKYKLQLADIEDLGNKYFEIGDSFKWCNSRDIYHEMQSISNRSNNSVKLIKEIDKSIENNDFESINKTLNNRNKSLSKEDEILYLQGIKYELISRLRHNDEAIEFYKMKLSKNLKKEIKF